MAPGMWSSANSDGDLTSTIRLSVGISWRSISAISGSWAGDGCLESLRSPEFLISWMSLMSDNYAAGRYCHQGGRHAKPGTEAGVPRTKEAPWTVELTSS